MSNISRTSLDIHGNVLEGLYDTKQKRIRTGGFFFDTIPLSLLPQSLPYSQYA